MSMLAPRACTVVVFGLSLQQLIGALLFAVGALFVAPIRKNAMERYRSHD